MGALQETTVKERVAFLRMAEEGLLSDMREARNHEGDVWSFEVKRGGRDLHCHVKWSLNPVNDL